jgi:galactokinase
MQEIIRKKFVALFNQEPSLYRSPGRVNLIGEHTDYNDGFVLPAAINKDVIFAIAPNNTMRIRFYSFDLDEHVSFELKNTVRSNTNWANYLVGVVAQFQSLNFPVQGFDLVFGGNIPIGAGLSSSAAIECGLAFGLNHLFGYNLDRFTLAKMAQKAEHEFAGVRCGIMDQFASLFGKEGHVIKLDCRSLEYEYYPFNMSQYRIVLCDTEVKHSLASTEYNTRREECETGIAVLSNYYPTINSLRDVTIEMLQKHQKQLNPVVFKRCMYVIQENIRVEAASQALLAGDLVLFGEKMYASHEGLQHDYEVSCRELDFLVDQTRKNDAVLGARMMGGGFGGCTINIVREDEVEFFISDMKQTYERQFNMQLKTYITEIANGSSQL